jgi:S1-C subfamily serine protease
MKIGIVASQSLKYSVAKSNLGNFNAEVRVDETLRKSVYDLFACYFTQVTLVSDDSKFEGIDALVYCDYSVKGLTTLLEIMLKERKSDVIIADYRQEGSIMYREPFWWQVEGGITLGLATPIITQQIGIIYKDALLDNIATSISQINAKLRVDSRLSSYAKQGHHGSSESRQEASSDILREPSNSSIYEDIEKCVVIIRSSEGLGSGFFISNEGLIVTNAHVVGQAANVSILMKNGKTFIGQVVAIDHKRDLALVSIGGTDYPSLELTDLDKGCTVGSDVIAIGIPKGLGWSLSKGIISAVRQLEDVALIQTDTAINEGNSGGPLICVNSGRVIGINAFGFRRDVATGLNFAIASGEVRKAFPTYFRRKASHR